MTRFRCEIGALICGALLAAAPAGANTAPFTRITVDEAQAPWGKGLAEVDGDGSLDVVVCGGWVLGSRVYWYRSGDPTRYFIGEVVERQDEDLDALSAGDINGDGAPDVVVTKGIYWFENPRGKGGDPRQPWTAHIVDPDYITHDIRIADMNLDGRADILAHTEQVDRPGAKLYLQGLSDSWTTVTLANVPRGQGIAIGDINRDGRLDIVAGGMWIEQPVDPVADEWKRHDVATTRESTGFIAAGDINRDGRLDIVFVEEVPWPNELTWFEAPPDPANGVWVPHDVVILQHVHSLQLADMDSDGWLDIVTAEEQLSEQERVAIYYNDGSGAAWTEQILGTDGSHNLAIGDIEGDGDVDILGANWNPFETDGGAILLWINQSDTDGDGVTEFDNCTTVANPDQRDTNGDGYGNICDGDLNNDGATNTLDLNLYKLAHRSALGDSNYDADADFNGDGLINTLDLNIYKVLHRSPPGPSCCGG